MRIPPPLMPLPGRWSCVVFLVLFYKRWWQSVTVQNACREVARFADDYRRQHDKLDILAMIAGTFSTDFKK